MSKKNQDNRANQLNPNHEQFLQSRGENLSQEAVSHIQQTESKSKGQQSKEGLGAEAQRAFHQNQNSKKEGDR